MSPPRPVAEGVFCVVRVHAWRDAEYVAVFVVVESVGFAGDDVLAHEEDGTVQVVVIPGWAIRKGGIERIADVGDILRICV